MKTTEINGDTVMYYFKDQDGNTVLLDLTPSDKACIERDVDNGKMKGKLTMSNDVTLFWNVEF